MQTFLVGYLKAVEASFGAAEPDEGVNRYAKPYVTPQFYRVMTAPGLDADPIICAQDLPTQVQVGAPAVRGANVVLPVTMTWGDGNTTQGGPVTVRLSDLRIVAVACPG